MLISGVSAWKASANGFGLPDQDAFATARGEAFVATADNPSAIYYNPAGITQLAGQQFSRRRLWNLSQADVTAPQKAARLTTVPKTSPPFPSFFTLTPPRRAVELWPGRLCAFWREHGLAAGHGFPRGCHQRFAEIHHPQSGRGIENVAKSVHRWRTDGELCQDGFGTRPSISPNAAQLLPVFRGRLEFGLQFWSALEAA